MNNRANNKHSIFGVVGDFWYRQLSEDDPNGSALARAITHMVDANHAISDMDTTAQKLTGSLTNLANNITISFNPFDIRLVNIDLNKRISLVRPAKYSLPNTGALQIDDLTAGGTAPTAVDPALTMGDSDTVVILHSLFDDDLEINFTDEMARPMYFVPIPLTISPVCITTALRELTVNCSFLTNAGYILFYEDPKELFPASVICCRSAYITQPHILDYTYQVDNLFSAGSYVARYMRATHSPVALRLALAEVAGLPILTADSILQAIYEDEDNTIYEFDTETLFVPKYIDHTALDIGATYDAHTIIGEEYIKIYSQANTSAAPSWYRHDDLDAIWSTDGLSLATLTPFGAITVPDATGTFSTNGAVSGSTAHLKLSGVTGSSTGAYWAFVRQSEIHTNRYLASCSGATAAATVNLVDFYFDNMLTHNAIVIKLRTEELGHERHQNVLSFIRRDLPINVTPIIV